MELLKWRASEKLRSTPIVERLVQATSRVCAKATPILPPFIHEPECVVQLLPMSSSSSRTHFSCSETHCCAGVRDCGELRNSIIRYRRASLMMSPPSRARVGDKCFASSTKPKNCLPSCWSVTQCSVARSPTYHRGPCFRSPCFFQETYLIIVFSNGDQKMMNSPKRGSTFPVQADARHVVARGNRQRHTTRPT